MQEHVSAGEWERWLHNDREWKREALDHLIDHGERLSRLETLKEDAPSRAEQAAASSKKWAVIGTAVGTILNGVLIAFGVKAG